MASITRTPPAGSSSCRPAARVAMGIGGVLLLGAGLIGLASARSGLVIRNDLIDGMPVRYLIAAGRGPGSSPGVLIGHGFASSRQIMLGYAYTLARAGYAVALWDFSGHGANRNRLGGGDGLQADVDTALGWLLDQAEVDPERIAIIGHSMGSGAAMSAAIRKPEVFGATVAVSPTAAAVTSDRPRNLLLQAGSWEPRFVANATRLLEQAGGERGGENARRLVVIPNVEHITILFSARSHRAALDWLNQAFGHAGPDDRAGRAGQASAAADSRAERGIYVDRRPLWYATAVVGMIVLALAFAPLVRRTVGWPAADGPHGSARGRLGSARGRGFLLRALAGPAAATAAVAALAFVLQGTEGRGIGSIGGIAVGGAIALWFAIYGAVWLGIAFRPPGPGLSGVLAGLALFAVLWVFVGLLGQQVILQWILTPFRLIRFPIAALLAAPWMLAAGCAQAGGTPGRRLLVYAAQAVPVVVLLGALGLFVPGFFFVILILPALPVLLAVTATLGAVADDPWAYAVGNALFFGWVLVAVFPLS